MLSKSLGFLVPWSTFDRPSERPHTYKIPFLTNFRRFKRDQKSHLNIFVTLLNLDSEIDTDVKLFYNQRK